MRARQKLKREMVNPGHFLADDRPTSLPSRAGGTLGVYEVDRGRLILLASAAAAGAGALSVAILHGRPRGAARQAARKFALSSRAGTSGLGPALATMSGQRGSQCGSCPSIS